VLYCSTLVRHDLHAVHGYMLALPNPHWQFLYGILIIAAVSRHNCGNCKHDNCGKQVHLCVNNCQCRRRKVLGSEFWWPAWRWHKYHTNLSTNIRFVDKRGCNCCWRRSHLRPHNQWRRAVLGIPEVFSLRGVRMLSCEILPS
jgi:hypothetical protein